MTTYVFVLDKHHKSLMPCHPARARRLLKKGRARVHKMFPFTIRLVDRELEDSQIQPTVIKIDPGSKETGIAIVREGKDKTHHALYFINLKHRGQQIRDALFKRRCLRRGRRSRNLRYRSPRFLNRRRPDGWLAPSLQHRVDTVLSWVNRLRNIAPVTGLTQELVKFDTQLMQNSDIAGVEYQQGELVGFEVREYLLEKFGRKCVYCGAENVPLNIDHVVPRAKGGSNRVSNLVLACVKCNQKKGAKTVEAFLKGKPDTLQRVKNQLKAPLKDATFVNATRWKLFNELKATGLLVEIGTGALTKFNRHKFHVPKKHWLDALCIGNVQGVSDWEKLNVLSVNCCGRGAYQRTRTDKYGFPRGFCMRQKKVHGFASGDMVKAVVPKGKKKGNYFGMVAVRKTGSFNIQTLTQTIQGISYKYCRLITHSDGYSYGWERPPIPPRAEGRGIFGEIR